MPMAGRLADLWGVRRLFMGALAVFAVGSALAGAAQTLDQLIAARLVQAVGGGVLVPVGTRPPRTCSVARHGRVRSASIGALTFLGMAAGPVVGAAIIASSTPRTRWRRPGSRAARGRPRPGLAVGLLPEHPDRIIALVLTWAAAARLGLAPTARADRPRRRRVVRDRAGAGLIGLTLSARPSSPDRSVDPGS
jgi:MFS family permease